MPAALRGGGASTRLEREFSRHAPPLAAAPTGPEAALTSALLAHAKRVTKSSPSGSAPALQLHSLRSPSAPSARPMAGKSSASCPSVVADHSPAANLTRPGAPWAMTCTASRSRLPCSASAIWRAAGREEPSTIASTSGRKPPRIVTMSETEGSTKRISDLSIIAGFLLLVATLLRHSTVAMAWRLAHLRLWLMRQNDWGFAAIRHPALDGLQSGRGRTLRRDFGLGQSRDSQRSQGFRKGRDRLLQRSRPASRFQIAQRLSSATRNACRLRKVKTPYTPCPTNVSATRRPVRAAKSPCYTLMRR